MMMMCRRRCCCRNAVGVAPGSSGGNGAEALVPSADSGAVPLLPFIVVIINKAANMWVKLAQEF